MENLITALDNGYCAIELILDFEKAFDTVGHHILLDKFYCLAFVLQHTIGLLVICQIVYSRLITMDLNLILG